MFGAKKYLYLIALLCFLAISFSFHSWAEKRSKEGVPDRERPENQQEQAPVQDQPRISFDAIKYDAGEVWEGEEVAHTFIVKNTGTAQLDIKNVRAG